MANQESIARRKARQAATWQAYYAKHGARLRTNNNKRRAAARRRPGARPCTRCGTLFTPKLERARFCSKLCQRASRVRYPERDNAKRRTKTARRRELLPERACLRCRKSFKPKRRSTAQYCSERCGIKSWGRRQIVTARQGQSDALCRGCSKRFKPYRFTGQLCCSERCNSRFWSKEHPDEVHRQTLERRARLKGVAVERVQPFLVFARDGWRCQLCGCATPKRLLGTTSRRKPTIDHIVPISRGGQHSYANVQCACAACNNRKSARTKGQFRLF